MITTGKDPSSSWDVFWLPDKAHAWKEGLPPNHGKSIYSTNDYRVFPGVC